MLVTVRRASVCVHTHYTASNRIAVFGNHCAVAHPVNRTVSERQKFLTDLCYTVVMNLKLEFA